MGTVRAVDHRFLGLPWGEPARLRWQAGLLREKIRTLPRATHRRRGPPHVALPPVAPGTPTAARELINGPGRHRIDPDVAGPWIGAAAVPLRPLDTVRAAAHRLAECPSDDALELPGEASAAAPGRSPRSPMGCGPLHRPTRPRRPAFQPVQGRGGSLRPAPRNGCAPVRRPARRPGRRGGHPRRHPVRPRPGHPDPGGPARQRADHVRSGRTGVDLRARPAPAGGSGIGRARRSLCGCRGRRSDDRAVRRPIRPAAGPLGALRPSPSDLAKATGGPRRARSTRRRDPFLERGGQTARRAPCRPRATAGTAAIRSTRCGADRSTPRGSKGSYARRQGSVPAFQGPSAPLDFLVYICLVWIRIEQKTRLLPGENEEQSRHPDRHIPTDDNPVVGHQTDGRPAAGFAAFSSPGGPDAARSARESATATPVVLTADVPDPFANVSVPHSGADVTAAVQG